MIPIDKSFLDSQITSLLSRQQNLQWLVEQNTTADSIANFGCHIGGETLSLMYTFGAKEGIGIDIDESRINQAKTTYQNIKENLQRIWQMLQYYPSEISEDDKDWWNNHVPDFFRKDMIQEGFELSYIVQDITKPTQLKGNYYDFAYCDFVLHHIWYDETRSDPRNDTLVAICEMARVIKPGGIVAAKELLQFSDKPRLDFKKLFVSAGLLVKFEKVTNVSENERKSTYIELIASKPE
jgi:ubiquinone/menaquinone biosynthesis C-methylase UbiE